MSRGRDGRLGGAVGRDTHPKIQEFPTSRSPSGTLPNHLISVLLFLMLLFVNVDLFPQIDIKFGHFSCKSLSSVAVNLEPINGLNNVLKETCLIITVLPLFAIIKGKQWIMSDTGVPHDFYFLDDPRTSCTHIKKAILFVYLSQQVLVGLFLLLISP